MKQMTWLSIIAITTVLLAGIPVIAGAAPVSPDSSITYTITLGEDGTADWHVEYPDASCI